MTARRIDRLELTGRAPHAVAGGVFERAASAVAELPVGEQSVTDPLDHKPLRQRYGGLNAVVARDGKGDAVPDVHLNDDLFSGVDQRPGTRVHRRASTTESSVILVTSVVAHRTCGLASGRG